MQAFQINSNLDRDLTEAIVVWIVVSFIESLLLLARANREGLELASKQRLLFLWAFEVLCCFVFFLWSFQDPRAPRADSLYQHGEETLVAERRPKGGISMGRET